MNERSTTAQAEGVPAGGLVYDSSTAGRRPLWSGLLEVVRYKDFLRLLIATNVKSRYKRSVLGIGWSLLSPLLTMIVMSIAFSAIFRFSVPNYPVYVLAGLVFFGFFQESTTQSMRSLVWGSSLLKKVYVPAATYPLSSVGTALVNLTMSLAPVLLIMLVLGQRLSWSLLFLPVAMVLLACFSLGVGLIMSTVAVRYTDVVEMWGVLVRALFYLTPVMYPEDILPERFVWLVRANPLYHLLACWRDPIYAGVLPSAESLAVSSAGALIAVVAGWWIFVKNQHEFALRA